MENLLKLGLLTGPSLAIDSDSYKYSHWVQYPKSTTAMESFFECRGNNQGIDKTVFFGLQYYLIRYMQQRITIKDVEEAEAFAKAHGCPFNLEGWMYIAKDLDGKIPVTIKAVPEGSVIPLSNILFSVRCDDPKVFWITSWVETCLVRLWYPISVATNSYNIKQTIRKYKDISSDDTKAELPFALHDFGSRGATCLEAAMIGGAAHLVNFKGSDTTAGVWMSQKYYFCDMPAFSIPASEHSTMTMWGKEFEVEAFRNMLKQYKDYPIIACVSDSWDIYNAAENLWGQALIKEVKEHDGLLVIRPDSGDPKEVILNLLKILDLKFGYTINTKGYKVLNDVRLLQGDGINGKDVDAILNAIVELGYSATNVAFGMGGGLLQKDLDRDTYKVAFKCCSAVINGKEVDVFKDPITDKVKKSKKGRMGLFEVECGKVRTLKANALPGKDLLKTVFKNGEIVKTYTLDKIRLATTIAYEQHTGWYDNKTTNDEVY